MARKRFVSSGISTNTKEADLAEENPTAALMWPWFITALDDWGRMVAEPMEVKLTVFPAFPFTSKDIREAILCIHNAGLAHLYQVDGKNYLAVEPESWFKYQTYISAKRKKDESKIPAPIDAPWLQKVADNSQVLNEIAASSEEVAEILQQSQHIAPSLSLSLSPTLSNSTEFVSSFNSDMNLFKIFESEKFGDLTPVVGQMLGDMEDTFTNKWVVKAMEQAIFQNKKSLSYIDGILKRWKDTKHPEPWTLEKESPPSTQGRSNSGQASSGKSYAQNRDKPKIIQLSADQSSSRPTEEELNAMRETARRLDEKLNNIPRRADSG